MGQLHSRSWGSRPGPGKEMTLPRTPYCSGPSCLICIEMRVPLVNALRTKPWSLQSILENESLLASLWLTAWCPSPRVEFSTNPLSTGLSSAESKVRRCAQFYLEGSFGGHHGEKDVKHHLGSTLNSFITMPLQGLIKQIPCFSWPQSTVVYIVLSSAIFSLPFSKVSPKGAFIYVLATVSWSIIFWITWPGMQQKREPVLQAGYVVFQGCTASLGPDSKSSFPLTKINPSGGFFFLNIFIGV